MTTKISRARIIELAHAATSEPHKIDDGWLARFMASLAQEDSELAKAVIKAADARLKEVE